MAYERVQKSFGQSSSQKKHTPIVPPLIDQQTQADSQLSPKVKPSRIPSSEERDAIRRSLFEKWGNATSSSIADVRTHIQAKLMIGEPGDKYEQEADRVAAQVVNQINAPVAQQSDENLQREKASEEYELQMKPMLQLQSSAGITANSDLETTIQQARDGGHSLADNIREPMEQAFGADFSGVKVHTDTQAEQLNQSIQARAFTTGQDVFFRQGEYSLGSRVGQELIAHELTHVVQQNSGVVQRASNEITPEERRYYEATSSGLPKAQLLNELITELGFTEEDSVAKIFKSICNNTRDDSYVGTASSLQAALRSRTWNCESLSALLIEICQQLKPQMSARLDSVQTRKISIERLQPNINVFPSGGNVIDQYNDPPKNKPTRISFESHTRALIDGTLYDPLMGVSGPAADKIWEYDVNNSNEMEYIKTNQRSGPIFIGIMKRRVASTP